MRTRLVDLGCPSGELDALIAGLEADRFLDEARFARAYVRGKHHQNGWGPRRIRVGLAEKGVPGELVESSLESELPPEVCLATATRLAAKKARTLREPPGFERDVKLSRFLAGKGYEGGVVRQALRGLGGGTEVAAEIALDSLDT